MPDVGASPPRLVELLAPAGDRASLVAAVRAGADAVYLGLRELNARRGAGNFSLEGLAEACDLAHLRGARVYLTANVLVLPEEMTQAVSLVEDSWTAGVDAVIVQDLGLARLVRRLLPDVRLHASTQIGAHNRYTVATLADIGFERVTLARELSLAEIGDIAEAVPIEIETFVHGALCFCYSGQCLLGSMVSGRSANRGLCAQPCRLPYTLLDEAGHATPSEGRHLLSVRDLAGIARLPEFTAAGVAALKIEGRMKSPEYVALVTGVYREALDRAASNPDSFEVTDGEWSILEEAFNRGFTDAYLDGSAGEELMARSRPNNRGVLVGRVQAVDGHAATVRLDRALEPEDRIEYWTSRGHFMQRVAAPAPAGMEVSLETDEPVAPGDRVFRVANASLLAAARRVYTGAREPRPVPVAFRVDVRVGAPLRISVAAAGEESFAEGPIVEAARTKTIGSDEIIEHVGRLGGTPYAASDWDIRLDAAAGLGYAALHRTRREALERLDAARLAAYRERSTTRPAVPTPEVRARPGQVALVAMVGDVCSGAACLAAGADRILVNVDPGCLAADLPPGMTPRLPRIAHDCETDAQMSWVAEHDICSGNLGVAARAAAAGVGVEGDWPLNATNSQAVAVLAELGLGLVWLSPELTIAQVARVASESPVPVGVSVLGYQELVVSEHCLLQALGPCDRRCASCGRRGAPRWLEDRKGYRMPVWSDAAGRSHLANALALDATRALADIVAAGVCAVRLDLEKEPRGEAARLTAAVRERLDAAAGGSSSPEERLLEPATGGHFFRGVG